MPECETVAPPSERLPWPANLFSASTFETMVQQACAALQTPWEVQDNVLSLEAIVGPFGDVEGGRQVGDFLGTVQELSATYMQRDWHLAVNRVTIEYTRAITTRQAAPVLHIQCYVPKFSAFVVYHHLGLGWATEVDAHREVRAVANIVHRLLPVLNVLANEVDVSGLFARLVRTSRRANPRRSNAFSVAVSECKSILYQIVRVLARGVRLFVPPPVYCVFCGQMRTGTEIRLIECSCGFAARPGDKGAGRHKNGTTQMPRFDASTGRPMAVT